MSGSQITNASRRARGLRRLEVWIPDAYLARLDKLCKDSGYSRADQLLALIDAGLVEIDRLKR